MCIDPPIDPDPTPALDAAYSPENVARIKLARARIAYEQRVISSIAAGGPVPAEPGCLSPEAQAVVDAAVAWVDTEEPAIEECDALTAAVKNYRVALNQAAPEQVQKEEQTP
jgi:hypothetical protein